MVPPLIIGFVVAAALGLAIVLRSARHGVAELDGHPWLLADTAKLHVAIMGGLAGFAVTGIVLLASLARDRSGVASSSFNTVVSMFLVAYFYYVGNAFLISYLPDSKTSGDLVPRVHFSLVSTIEYRTLFVSWFALLPLLKTYGLDRPAEVLTVLLPLSLALGSVVIAMAADGLGLIQFKETYLSAAVGTALALIYAGIVRIAASIAPAAESALFATMVIFFVNGAGYAFAALTPLSPGYPRIERFFARQGRNLVIADMLLTMLALSFLWLAVAGAI